MQVSVETKHGLEKKMTVEIPAEEIDSEVSKRLSDLARTAKLDGFRPGKVPLNLLKKRYGQSVRMEVVGDVMQKSLYKAIQQEHLHVVGTPSVNPTEIGEGKNMCYEATFEVLPEFTVTGLNDVAIELVSAEIADSDIDETLEKMRAQNKVWESVDRAAKLDDQLNIDFLGKLNDEPFEGGKAEGFDLVLGSNSMIPGFEDGLVGAKAGDDLSLNITFPEDYHHNDLAGKDTVFEISVNSVKEGKVAELNDEFAKQFKLENLQALKDDIKKAMERELKQKLNEHNHELVFDQLIKLNPLELPKALIDEEIKRAQERFMRMVAGRQQIDMSQMPELKSEFFEDRAKRSVHLGLLLNQFISQEQIKAEAEKINEHIEEMASLYEDKDEAVKWFSNDKNQRAQIEAVVLENQVVEKLKADAKVSDKKLSYQAAMELKQQAPEQTTEEKQSDTKEGSE